MVSPNNFYLSGASKINSISLLVPINYNFGMKIPEVWKIFSQTPLTEDDLDEIFRTREDIKTVDWLAYPEYSSHYQAHELGNFTLHPGLFHINAIEWAASAMEMSALGGKNVANLILKQLKTLNTPKDEL